MYQFLAKLSQHYLEKENMHISMFVTTWLFPDSKPRLITYVT